MPFVNLYQRRHAICHLYLLANLQLKLVQYRKARKLTVTAPRCKNSLHLVAVQAVRVTKEANLARYDVAATARRPSARQRVTARDTRVIPDRLRTCASGIMTNLDVESTIRSDPTPGPRLVRGPPPTRGSRSSARDRSEEPTRISLLRLCAIGSGAVEGGATPRS